MSSPDHAATARWKRDLISTVGKLIKPTVQTSESLTSVTFVTLYLGLYQIKVNIKVDSLTPRAVPTLDLKLYINITLKCMTYQTLRLPLSNEPGHFK